MNTKEFNNVLKLSKHERDAAYNLIKFCLYVIKGRLLFRNEFYNLDKLSREILNKFLAANKKYISNPWAYLNKCVDTYLSDRKKYAARYAPLNENISYEPYFDHIAKTDAYKWLRLYLDEENAIIFYMYAVEEAKEYEIAEKTGIAYDAVRKRISRLKKKLQEIINKINKNK